MDDRKFRHEFKYVVSRGQCEMLKNRLNHLLTLDRHAGPEGCYTIRSLYFDDCDYRCYAENANGVDPREKFRIRIYNHRTDRIMLECKRKERGKTLKTSCPLTIEQTRQLMAGKPLADIAQQPPVLQKLTTLMLARGMRPVVVVEYTRIPYVYKCGNVRVTLDMNITASSATGSFLEEQIPQRPVMPVGKHLLEVKYDEYLPDFIYRQLQLDSLTQTAFSKYFMGMKFTR